MIVELKSFLYDINLVEMIKEGGFFCELKPLVRLGGISHLLQRLRYS